MKPRIPCHRLASGRVERGFIRHNMICEASDTVTQTREDRIDRCDANDLHGVILCIQVDEQNTSSGQQNGLY